MPGALQGLSVVRTNSLTVTSLLLNDKQKNQSSGQRVCLHASGDFLKTALACAFKRPSFSVLIENQNPSHGHGIYTVHKGKVSVFFYS